MDSRQLCKRTVLSAVLAMALLVLPAAGANAAPPVKVTEAIPESAEQGTVNLDVTIKGRNFEDAGAVARFFLTDTADPGGVMVNSTTFVDSTTVIANITIDEDETHISLYDIEVEMEELGRKGKGTEKFNVTPKGGGGNDEISLCADFRNTVGDTVQSDLVSSTYCDGAESNLVVIIGNVNGRHNLHTDGTSRELVLEYPDCGRLIDDANCSTTASLNTLNRWEDQGGWLMPTGEFLNFQEMDFPGGEAWVDFQVAFPSVSKSTPNLLIFGGSNHFLCGDPAHVTRVDEDNWVIEATTQTSCLVEVFKKGNRRVVHPPFGASPFSITLTRQP